jgi:hypothetical protein
LAQDALHQAIGLKVEDIFADETEAVEISDEHGPIMAVRFHRALRVAIQFYPNRRFRIAKVAREVVEWFKKLASDGRFKEIIIRPGGKARKFAKKLGFTPFTGRMIGI